MEEQMNKKLIISIISVAFIMVLGFTFWLAPHNSVKAADSAQQIKITTNSQQGIWVSGQGTITVTPDIAVINMGVTAQAAKLSEAMARASAAMDKIMKALADGGIAKKDIQTSNFNIQQIQKPVTVYSSRAPEPITSFSTGTASSSSGKALTVPGSSDQADQSPQYLYQVTNTVTVIVRDMDKVGTLIDAVATAGGDLTRINGVNFSVEKPQQYYDNARKAAMKDAQEKAQQLAQLSGVTLGKAFYISESSYTPPSVYSSTRGAYYAADATTAISPGQTQINLSIQVAYTIQ
jgi:uncharacterized protein